MPCRFKILIIACKIIIAHYNCTKRGKMRYEISLYGFLGRKNSLVHAPEPSNNPSAIPAWSDNHHLDDQNESVLHKYKNNKSRLTNKQVTQTQCWKLASSLRDTHLTTSMMSTISPIQVCCTTIIICVNQLMDYYLIDLILNVHVITTYNYLKYT